MQKKSILNLIKYHSERNDVAFREQAYEIADEFDKTGDHQLAHYIMATLSDVNTFVPQGSENENDLKFIRKVDSSKHSIFLPDEIKVDLIGLTNAIKRNMGLNRFLFAGKPGTGKTESAKQLARILKRQLYIVEFDDLIDSLLGKTAKNINAFFKELNHLQHPERTIILFDEIDALALNRTDRNDIREMGRATTAIIRGLDTLNRNVIVIATTNLYDDLDKALLRRFNTTIDFNRYTQKDLSDVAEMILEQQLKRFKDLGKNMPMFHKILASSSYIPYPGDLENMIETAIAFSDVSDKYDYLRRLYKNFAGQSPKNIERLKKQKFTLREMEILSGISKSTISRELRSKVHE